MNLFDELIKEILGQLNLIAAAEVAKTAPLAKPWKDVGEHHMILQKETAYELGGGSTFGLSGCLYTTNPILLQEGVYLYGKDLTQIRETQSYARIVLAELEKADEKEALYRKFREIDYVRYHIHPKGYMARISPVSQREPVRIAKKALSEHISFGAVGQMYLERCRNISSVKNVNVIFITQKEFDYTALDEKLRKAEQITQSLNYIFTNLSMDCGTCGLKSVCDEVEGLRKLHFDNRSVSKK